MTDTRTGITRSYRNDRGTAFLPIQRTGDFSVCNAVVASRASSGVFPGAGAAANKPSLVTMRGERWEAGATALCLNNGRFQVRASYDSDTGAGDGHGVSLSSDTGYFWFFSPNNVEIVVKVLNACSLSQNFWVFAGGLTNVGVTLTVTDTQTGATRVYRNVRGNAYLPLQKTTDFGVCP